MAFVRQASWAGGQSGRLGNVVLAQTEAGTIMRARPERRRERSPGQRAQESRMADAKRAWDALSDEEVALWRRYSLDSAVRDPRSGTVRRASAYALFSGLGSKVLQLSGGTAVPRTPPQGRFLGDSIRVTVSAGTPSPSGSSWRGGQGERGPEHPSQDPTPAPPQGEGFLLYFTADGANRPGMVTELLVQRLPGRHNATRPRSWTSLGFVAFAAGETVEVAPGKLGWIALAVRFVEAASGRMTEPMEIGRAQLTQLKFR